MGWNWVKQIGRFHEVWVINRANNLSGIDKALALNPLTNIHWIFFDLPEMDAILEKRRKRSIFVQFPVADRYLFYCRVEEDFNWDKKGDLFNNLMNNYGT